MGTKFTQGWRFTKIEFHLKAILTAQTNTGELAAMNKAAEYLHALSAPEGGGR